MIVKYLYLMWLYFSACVLNYGIAFLLPNFYNLGVYVILTIVTSIVITTEFLMGVIKNQYQQIPNYGQYAGKEIRKRINTT